MIRTVHIVDSDSPDPEKEFEVVVARCGKTGLIWPDATLTPEDFDFVGPEWVTRVTCAGCIVADPAASAISRITEMAQ